MEYSGSIVYSIWSAQILPLSVSTDKGKWSAWSAKGRDLKGLISFCNTRAIRDLEGVDTHPGRPAWDKGVDNSLQINKSKSAAPAYTMHRRA